MASKETHIHNYRNKVGSWFFGSIEGRYCSFQMKNLKIEKKYFNGKKWTKFVKKSTKITEKNFRGQAKTLPGVTGP